jgi:hypothetical protein
MINRRNFSAFIMACPIFGFKAQGIDLRWLMTNRRFKLIFYTPTPEYEMTHYDFVHKLTNNQTTSLKYDFQIRFMEKWVFPKTQWSKLMIDDAKDGLIDPETAKYCDVKLYKDFLGNYKIKALNEFKPGTIDLDCYDCHSGFLYG